MQSFELRVRNEMSASSDLLNPVCRARGISYILCRILAVPGYPYIGFLKILPDFPAPL